jgi:hypothetical protein
MELVSYIERLLYSLKVIIAYGHLTHLIFIWHPGLETVYRLGGHRTNLVLKKNNLYYRSTMTIGQVDEQNSHSLMIVHLAYSLLLFFIDQIYIALTVTVSAVQLTWK